AAKSNANDYREGKCGCMDQWPVCVEEICLHTLWTAGAVGANARGTGGQTTAKRRKRHRGGGHFGSYRSQRTRADRGTAGRNAGRENDSIRIGREVEKRTSDENEQLARPEVR